MLLLQFQLTMFSCILFTKGGHAAALNTQRLIKDYKDQNIPKAQGLLYPLLQNYNHRLPSRIYYTPLKNKDNDTIDDQETLYWVMGITNFTREMTDALKMNLNTLLVKDSNYKNKIESYLNLSYIDEKYKKDRDYYNQVDPMYPSKLDPNSVLNKDAFLANKLLELSGTEHSPGLADDSVIKTLPLTYLIVCEVDMLKDENLIFAERLRKNNVQVKLRYYEHAYHGMISYFELFDVAREMYSDFVKFLKEDI